MYTIESNKAQQRLNQILHLDPQKRKNLIRLILSKTSDHKINQYYYDVLALCLVDHYADKIKSDIEKTYEI